MLVLKILMMLRVHAPSTCFRIFVFDNFISIPLFIARFFPNLFATIDGTRRVSDPVNEFLLNLKVIDSVFLKLMLIWFFDSSLN